MFSQWVESLIPLICAKGLDTNIIVNTQLAIVSLWSFIGMHLSYNLFKHNELALSIH